VEKPAQALEHTQASRAKLEYTPRKKAGLSTIIAIHQAEEQKGRCKFRQESAPLSSKSPVQGNAKKVHSNGL